MFRFRTFRQCLCTAFCVEGVMAEAGSSSGPKGVIQATEGGRFKVGRSLGSILAAAAALPGCLASHRPAALNPLTRCLLACRSCFRTDAGNMRCRACFQLRRLAWCAMCCQVSTERMAVWPWCPSAYIFTALCIFLLQSRRHLMIRWMWQPRSCTSSSSCRRTT